MRSQASLGCASETAITHRTNLLATNAEGPGLISSGYFDLGLVGLEVCIPAAPRHPPPQPAMSALRRTDTGAAFAQIPAVR